jgi:SNF2 family DNA or RNA helicase
MEAIPYINEVCDLLDLDYRGRPWELKHEAQHVPTSDLYPYQQSEARLIYSNPRLVLFEMGLGKTAPTIRAFQEAHRVLVVCPAVVRQTWRDQIKRWAPQIDKVFVRTKGTDIWPSEGWVITSYALMPDEDSRWDAIVFDESHLLKNDRSQRTKHAFKLRERNAKAKVALLTGTPIADNPLDLWAQLNMAYPGRYGSFFRFKMRYANKVPNPYTKSGYSYEGLNEERADELARRVSKVASRVTKAEVAHLIQPLSVIVNRIVPESFLAKDEWADPKAYEEWAAQHSSAKVTEAVEWARNLLEQERNVLIFAHFRRTAKAIAKAFKVVPITGAISAAKRNQAIAEALEEPGPIVCTIDSVGIGIDTLAEINVACFAELDYYPAKVLQAMARVHRLSSQRPVTITLFVYEGTIDEKIALALEGKLVEANRVLKGGLSETKIQSALGKDDRDWEKHMAAVAEGAIEDIWDYEY